MSGLHAESAESAESHVRHAELPMLRAYRLWFEHTRKCTYDCQGASTAQDGCETGRELWGAYRLARIGEKP